MQRLGRCEWSSTGLKRPWDRERQWRALPPTQHGAWSEHLHPRPVVRELVAAIGADDVSSGYAGCCTITTQLAARTVMGKLRLLCQQPKTRSNRLIESAWIEATIDAAIRNSRPSAQARVRFWTGLIFRISNRSRYARPRPQYQPPPPSKNTISTTTKIVSTLILKSS